MDWNKANDYCQEIGGQLPTPIGASDDNLLKIAFADIGMF